MEKRGGGKAEKNHDGEVSRSVSAAPRQRGGKMAQNFPPKSSSPALVWHFLVPHFLSWGMSWELTLLEVDPREEKRKGNDLRSLLSEALKVLLRVEEGKEKGE